MINLFEQTEEEEEELALARARAKAKAKAKSKTNSQDNSQTTTKPKDQPTDDGIPGPSTNKSITIRLLYRNGTDVQDENFILAVQNALNKGGDDYSPNNIFK